MNNNTQPIPPHTDPSPVNEEEIVRTFLLDERIPLAYRLQVQGMLLESGSITDAVLETMDGIYDRVLSEEQDELQNLHNVIHGLGAVLENQKNTELGLEYNIVNKVTANMEHMAEEYIAGVQQWEREEAQAEESAEEMAEQDEVQELRRKIQGNEDEAGTSGSGQ